MKKIFALYITRLNNKQHFSFMQLSVAACSLYPVVGDDFSRLVESLRAAFGHEDRMFVHHDRAEISKRLQEAEDERTRLFRHMRDFIKTYETCGVQAKVATAGVLMDIIASYGGGDIPSQKADERSASISNLVDDLQSDYPAQVAELGCTEIVAELKVANQAYLDLVTERAQFDAENGLAMLATARKQTDAAYRALVEAVNAAATVDGQGELTAYIDYMNVNVRHYRMKIGQSLADMDGTTAGGGAAAGGTGSEDVVMRNVTFEFAGGNVQKFRMEAGAPLEALPNTLGFKWKPEVPALVPNRNIVFREVPIDDREVVLTFHFLSHEDEELRGVVGTLLNAPVNTEGCHWEPTVPRVFPDVDMTFNEVLDETGVVKYTVAWYLPNGNPIVWYELAPGERIPEAPTPPEGYYWHPYPDVMPNRDLDIIPEPIQG